MDVLHYNAASLRKATLAVQPVETFNSDLAVNIGGAMAAAQAVMATMSARQSGSILLTDGTLGINPSPGHLSLSIGKAGIRALTLGLFDATKEKGVHVATVTVGAYYVQLDSGEASEIAEEFWKLHIQKDNWTAETIYSPSAE
ncbi:SDR family NAD(P)-dependent oxidoreductase [Rouxiella silvae]